MATDPVIQRQIAAIKAARIANKAPGLATTVGKALLHPYSFSHATGAPTTLGMAGSVLAFGKLSGARGLAQAGVATDNMAQMAKLRTTELLAGKPITKVDAGVNMQHQPEPQIGKAAHLDQSMGGSPVNVSKPASSPEIPFSIQDYQLQAASSLNSMKRKIIEQTSPTATTATPADRPQAVADAVMDPVGSLQARIGTLTGETASRSVQNEKHYGEVADYVRSTANQPNATVNPQSTSTTQLQGPHSDTYGTFTGMAAEESLVSQGRAITQGLGAAEEGIAKERSTLVELAYEKSRTLHERDAGRTFNTYEGAKVTDDKLVFLANRKSTAISSIKQHKSDIRDLKLQKEGLIDEIIGVPRAMDRSQAKNRDPVRDTGAVVAHDDLKSGANEVRMQEAKQQELIDSQRRTVLNAGIERGGDEIEGINVRPSEEADGVSAPSLTGRSVSEEYSALPDHSKTAIQPSLDALQTQTRIRTAVQERSAAAAVGSKERDTLAKMANKEIIKEEKLLKNFAGEVAGATYAVNTKNVRAQVDMRSGMESSAVNEHLAERGYWDHLVGRNIWKTGQENVFQGTNVERSQVADMNTQEVGMKLASGNDLTVHNNTRKVFTNEGTAWLKQYDQANEGALSKYLDIDPKTPLRYNIERVASGHQNDPDRYVVRSSFRMKTADEMAEETVSTALSGIKSDTRPLMSHDYPEQEVIKIMRGMMGDFTSEAPIVGTTVKGKIAARDVVEQSTMAEGKLANDGTISIASGKDFRTKAKVGTADTEVYKHAVSDEARRLGYAAKYAAHSAEIRSAFPVLHGVMQDIITDMARMENQTLARSEMLRRMPTPEEYARTGSVHGAQSPSSSSEFVTGLKEWSAIRSVDKDVDSALARRQAKAWTTRSADEIKLDEEFFKMESVIQNEQPQLLEHGKYAESYAFVLERDPNSVVPDHLYEARYGREARKLTGVPNSEGIVSESEYMKHAAKIEEHKALVDAWAGNKELRKLNDLTHNLDVEHKTALYEKYRAAETGADVEWSSTEKQLLEQAKLDARVYTESDMSVPYDRRKSDDYLNQAKDWRARSEDYLLRNIEDAPDGQIILAANQLAKQDANTMARSGIHVNARQKAITRLNTQAKTELPKTTEELIADSDRRAKNLGLSL